MADFVCGANEPDFHLRGVNFGRDCREPDRVADLRNVVAGDPSPDGEGTLEILRGIEVGHVFALGTKYSQAMGATYLDARVSRRLIEMGCYGIGVTRVVAAAIEQNHDDHGHHLARGRSRRSRWRSRRSATIAAKRSGALPTACTTSSRPPGSRCCWTTAASGPA